MSPHDRAHGAAPSVPDPLPLPVVDNHTHLDIRRRDVADAIAPDGGEERTTQDVAAALAAAAMPAMIAGSDSRCGEAGFFMPTDRCTMLIESSTQVDWMPSF